MIDPANRVVALCAEGMAIEGSPADAMRLFEQAWALRTDDFEAAVAAHFVARHQPTPADTRGEARGDASRSASRRRLS
jgi:hypothetical protein